MKIYVQWSLADPQDWQLLDMATVQAWRNLPKKAQPVGGEVIDNTPGWPFSINIQGVRIEGFDHYAANIVNKRLVVTAWSDDPEDYPDPADWFAHVWSFGNLKPDPRYNGELNTDQLLTVYASGATAERWQGQSTSSGPVTVLPWAQFSPPAANLTRHGIWLTEEGRAGHVAVRAVHGFTEWAA